MNRLDICISNDDCSVKYGCSAQSTATTGGFDRLYKRTDTKHHVVTCSTLLSEEDYQYFRAFYLDWQDDPQEFICKLIIEGFDYYGSLLQDYVCSFVKDSVSFDVEVGHFRVNFQLDVFINPLASLTSKPYTYYFREDIDGDFSLDEIELKTPITELESIQASFSLDDIQYRELLNKYNAEIESVQAVFSLDDIQITSKPSNLYYTQPIENVSVDFSLDDIKVTRIVSYLTYTLEVDRVQVDFELNDIQITN